VRFKIDENLPAEVADLLRTAGHDAETVADEGLSGTQDPALFGIIQIEKRGIITLDRGFANILRYPPADFFGIIILRAKRQDKVSLISLAGSFIPMLKLEPLEGKLWVVEEDRIRIR